MNALKKVAATIIGLLLAGLSVALVQLISSFLYPTPADLDLKDPQQLSNWVKTLPTPAFLIVLVSWAAGPLVGTIAARRLSPNRAMLPALIVWLLLGLATVSTLCMIPHPWWMWPAGLFVWFVFGMLGMALSAPASCQAHLVRSIQAPLEQVFQTLARPEKFSEAIPDIRSIEIISSQKYGVGTRFRETRNMQGKTAVAEMEVAEQVENRLIRLVAEMGGTAWNTSFTVLPQNSPPGNSVQLEMLMTAQPKNLLSRLITPLMMGMVEKAVGADMDQVKAYCEAAAKK